MVDELNWINSLCKIRDLNINVHPKNDLKKCSHIRVLHSTIVCIITYTLNIFASLKRDNLLCKTHQF